MDILILVSIDHLVNVMQKHYIKTKFNSFKIDYPVSKHSSNLKSIFDIFLELIQVIILQKLNHWLKNWL